MGHFHDAIVYVDESGDHGQVSEEFPVLVLAFCLFEKRVYGEQVTASVKNLKFKYFGHDAVVLHEREIRKHEHDFSILQRKELREQFQDDLGDLIANAPFKLIASVIRKEKYYVNEDAYHHAMRFGVERVAHETGLQETSSSMHFVCEWRGTKENKELKRAFTRICEGDNYLGRRFPCQIVFGKKDGAHAGMEIADLVARPIGCHVLRPEQANRAWDILRRKFRTSPNGDIEGWGLKIFP